MDPFDSADVLSNRPSLAEFIAPLYRAGGTAAPVSKPPLVAATIISIAKSFSAKIFVKVPISRVRRQING